MTAAVLLAVAARSSGPAGSTDPVLCRLPQAPVQVSLDVEAGQSARWRARMSVTAEQPVANAYIKLLLPADALALGGTRWRSSLGAGERREFEVEFDLSGAADFEVAAAAYAEQPGGAIHFGKRIDRVVRVQGSAFAVEDYDPLDESGRLRRPVVGERELRAFAVKTPLPAEAVDAAGKLAYGSTVQLRGSDAAVTRVDGSEFRNYHRFFGRAGDWVRIEAFAEGFDAALQLYAPDGAALGFSDDADGLNPRIPQRGLLELERDGFYIAELRGPAGAVGSEYSIQVMRDGRKQSADQRLGINLEGDLLRWNPAGAAGEVGIERSCGAEAFREVARAAGASGAYPLLSGGADCRYRLVSGSGDWQEATSSVQPGVSKGGARREASSPAVRTVRAQGRFTYNFDNRETGIRRAGVLLVASNNGALSLLARGATNDNGNFDIPFDADAVPSSTVVFARILAQDDGTRIVTVLNTTVSLGGPAFADTASVGIPATATTIAIPQLNVNTLGANPLFYLYDSIVEGFLIATERLGFTPTVAVRLNYPARSSNGSIDEGGAFYFNNEIHIGRGYLADRDTALHEYGHFLADQNRFNQTQGGRHTIPFYERVNASLAWGESWATVFSVAGQRERGRQDIFYESNNASNRIRYSMEAGQDPEVIRSSVAGDDNEGSVQFVLWDLYDELSDTLPNASGARDTISIPLRSIFRAAQGPAVAGDGRDIGINLMIRFYSGLLRHVDAVHDGRDGVRGLFLDQRMDYPAAPPAPSNLRVSGATPVVTWDGSAGPGGSFNIERRTATGAFAFIANSAANTYTDRTAPANTELFYRVQAITPLNARESLRLLSRYSPVVSSTSGSTGGGGGGGGGGGAVPRIDPGQTVNGTLSAASGRSVACGGCFADLYELTVTTTQTLTISLMSSSADAYLRILNTGRQVIAEDDDSGGNMNSRLTRSFTAGTYLVEASTFAAGQSGPYSLSVQTQSGGTPPPPPPGVFSIRPGQSLNGTLSASSGRSAGCSGCFADIYEMVLTSSQQLTITMNSSAVDSYLRVLDAGGAAVAADDDSGGGLNSRIERTFTAGTYRIEATTASSAQAGAYTIAVQSGGGGGGGLPGIAVGQSLNGNLTAASRRSVGCASCFADTYELVLTSAQQITIRMNSTPLDSFIRVLDSTGATLASDDDSGGGLNSLLTRTFSAGTYRIEATTAVGNQTGAYTLSVAGAGGGGAGLRISVGQTVNGTLGANSGRSAGCGSCLADVYELVVAGAQTLTLRMNSTSVDAYLRVMDTTGTALATDDDSGGGLNSLIRRAFSPGTYRIEATTAVGSQSGDYSLSVEAAGGGGGGIIPIALGQTMNGTLSANSARSGGCASCFADVYQLTLAGTQTVTVTMNSTAVDSFLRILDAAGSTLATDDDSGGGLNSRIQRTLSAGTYRIEATTAFGGQSGAYSISVQGAGGGGSAISVGQSVNGTLSSASGRSVGCGGCFADNYLLTVSSTQTLTITMNSSTVDSFLRVLDSSGNAIASDDDSGGALNARIQRLFTPGTYRIEATTAVGAQAGAYTLTVQSSGSGAVTIAVGQTVNGTLGANSGRSIGCGGCFSDTYQLVLTSTQVLTFTMTSSAVDSFLRIIDSGGNTVAADDDSGGGLNARIQRSLPADTYRIEATTAGSGQAGAYSLSVQGAATGGATVIVPGQTVNGTLTAQSGRSVGCATCLADLYQFTITSTQTLRITMNSTAVDSFLRVIDATGDSIAVDDDSGGALNSRIQRAFTAGTYRIEATTALGGQAGAYTLSLVVP